MPFWIMTKHFNDLIINNELCIVSRHFSLGNRRHRICYSHCLSILAYKIHKAPALVASHIPVSSVDSAVAKLDEMLWNKEWLAAQNLILTNWFICGHTLTKSILFLWELMCSVSSRYAVQPPATLGAHRYCQSDFNPSPTVVNTVPSGVHVGLDIVTISTRSTSNCNKKLTIHASLLHLR